MSEKNYRITKKGNDFLVSWTNKAGFTFHLDFIWNASFNQMDTHGHGPWPEVPKTMHDNLHRLVFGKPCTSAASARKLIDDACKYALKND